MKKYKGLEMNYADIQKARQDARQTISYADAATRDAAQLIVGRLKVANVSGWVLYELKRELKSFNMKTGQWTDKG